MFYTGYLNNVSRGVRFKQFNTVCLGMPISDFKFVAFSCVDVIHILLVAEFWLLYIFNGKRLTAMD